MVFSSNPLYLDPHSWQPQKPGDEINNNHLSLPVALSPPPINGGGSTNTAATNTGIEAIRHSSMAERARQAKVPQPEASLKCPRCESTNTKFCYFNNYSLNQPRHFCKTCRRYWTRGGSLRNVPVGGGFRTNKKNRKRCRSKSPVLPTGSRSTSHDMIRHFFPTPIQLPLLPSLTHLSDFGCGDLGLNFTKIDGGNIIANDFGFQVGNSTCDGRGVEKWRLRNFPFMAGLETPSGINPFKSESVNSQGGYAGAAPGHQIGSRVLDSGVNQVSAVKTEENRGSSTPRNFGGMMENDQYWGGNSIGNAWTDLPGFTSTSSTSHLLWAP